MRLFYSNRAPNAWASSIASLILRLTLCVLAAVGVASAEPADISGVWEMDNGREKAHIEISESDGTYSGKIVWLEKPTYSADDPRGMAGLTKVDRRNPDPSLRKRPIIGLEILTGLRRKGGDTFVDGEIYAPDRGSSFQCKARLGPDGVLRMRGFMGFSLLGRTMNWVKIPDDAD